MYKRISAQDILIAHIYVCHKLKKPAELVKPEVLRNIEYQLNRNLDWLSSMELAAYVAMQIVKNKPFLYLNSATAVALAMATVGNGKELRPASVKSAVEYSSVVDEVVDRLVLAGAK